MSREMLKNLIDLVPQEDIDTLYRVIIKFIPEDIPTEDEIKAIDSAKDNRDTVIMHEAVNWY